jgi:hypothetical protein
MEVVLLVTKWVSSNYYKTCLWNVRAACDIERRALCRKIVVKNGMILYNRQATKISGPEDVLLL